MCYTSLFIKTINCFNKYNLYKLENIYKLAITKNIIHQNLIYFATLILIDVLFTAN